jgi:5-oxoprolinase (ATP-hydrolysing) subunit A
MTTGARLNLNADLGESYGAWRMGDDEALLPLVQSANLACGFHAGDPSTMRRTVASALAAGVSLGAHPSYPDLQGFGRRSLRCSPQEVEDFVLYQIGALDGVARAAGARVTHVKPHGALSNDGCRDPALAEAIARAIQAYDSALILLAPALSLLAEAGAVSGLRVALEIFADRSYEADATLSPRGQPGAVLHDPAAILAHADAMLAAGGIVTRDGLLLPTPIHSLCLHGDGPGAVAAARALNVSLSRRFALCPLPDMLA